MTYFGTRREGVRFVAEELANDISNLTMTIRQGSREVCSVLGVIGSFFRQRKMSRHSLDRQQIISMIHRHAEHWESGTGQSGQMSEEHDDE